jgi:hypothetical protein
MPQISITVTNQTLVFLKKLAEESGESRSGMASLLLLKGLRLEVQERNAMAVYLSMESKRVDQREMIKKESEKLNNDL